MGKSGNPARRAAQEHPLTVRTHKAMNDVMALVRDFQQTDMHPDVQQHASAAAAGLMAVYSYQTGLPAPWDVKPSGPIP